MQKHGDTCVRKWTVEIWTYRSTRMLPTELANTTASIIFFVVVALSLSVFLFFLCTFVDLNFVLLCRVCGPNVPYNTIFETYVLVSNFSKFISKLTFRILETQVLCAGRTEYEITKKATSNLPNPNPHKPRSL